jgi:hypothetical protein
MQTPRQRAVIVAPEVAARIVALRVAGQSLSMITGCLHLTPGEVRARWASTRSRCRRGRDVGGVACRVGGARVLAPTRALAPMAGPPAREPPRVRRPRTFSAIRCPDA